MHKYNRLMTSKWLKNLNRFLNKEKDMVDTKEEKKELTFTYRKDGEETVGEVKDFTEKGQAIFYNLQLDREDEKEFIKRIDRLQVKLEDLRAGIQRRSDWLFENEINKKDDVEEAVEVVEQSTKN